LAKMASEHPIEKVGADLRAMMAKGSEVAAKTFKTVIEE